MILPQNTPWTVEEYLATCPPQTDGKAVRTELLDGRVVPMSPQGWNHVRTVSHLFRLLDRGLPPGFFILCQSSLRLDPFSMPEPDLAVVPGDPRALEDQPAACWVLEVSDTTLDRDLDKAILYARAMIAEYWILDLGNRRLLVHRKPTLDGYLEQVATEPGKMVACPLPGMAELAVADLFCGS